jgi:hypothetical protein
VGRALLGKEVDDEVKVRWDAGQRELVIVGITYEAPKATKPQLQPKPKAKAKAKAKRK